MCQIADTDKEILYTKGEATVVPGGSLIKYLKFCKKLAEYRRRGGLYIGKMKIKASNIQRPALSLLPGRVQHDSFQNVGYWEDP